MGKDGLGLLGSEAPQSFAELRVMIGHDGHGQQSGIDGAGTADGQGADRYARGHLHHGEEGIHPVQRFGFHRHAEHGQNRLGRDDTGQVSCSAGSGDDHLQATHSAVAAYSRSWSGVR